MDIMSDGPTLVLTGEFDVRSTMDVRTAIYDKLAGCDEDLVVDLTGVSTIDVTALKVLAAATVVASRQGRHLTLRGAGPAVRRMLHLSRLIRAVEVERVAAERLTAPLPVLAIPQRDRLPARHIRPRLGP